MQKFVEINGVDVTQYVISFTVEKRLTDSYCTAQIFLQKNMTDVLQFNDETLTNKDVTIARGVDSPTEEYLLRGFVREIEFRNGIVHLHCEDKLSLCRFRVVNDVYDRNIDPEQGVISEILKTLLLQHTNLDFDDTTIQNSGTTFVLNKFVLRRRNLMDTLFELTNTIDWQLYYNSDTDKVHFEPKGFIESGQTLTVGQEIVNNPVWEIITDQQFNQITLRGTSQELLQELGPFQLDGSQDGWTTSGITILDKPVVTQLFVDSNNPPEHELRGGVVGSSRTFDYVVDKERGVLSFQDFEPNSTDWAFLRYTYNVPVQVVRRDQTSVDTYGLKETSQFREDVKTTEDAQRWASNQLKAFKNPFFKTEIRVRFVPFIRVGKLYTIVDNQQNVNQTLLVTDTKFSYPYNYDVVEVSDREHKTANWATDIPQRIRRLEEREAASEELINVGYDFTTQTLLRNRYTKREKRTLTGDNGKIFGNPHYSEFGKAKFGAVDRIVETDTLVPGGNIFHEWGYDEKFYNDAESVGVTFDTTENTIEIDGTYYTDLIAKGFAYSQVRFISSSTSDPNIEVQITSDNKTTWQTLQKNVLTPLQNSNGEGTYVRINNIDTPATLRTRKDVNGKKLQPAFKVQLYG